MKLRLVPLEEMARRHAAARRIPAGHSPPPPVNMRNERVVLDLGNLTFFTFQGRAYGVPPLPYKAGVVLASISAGLQKLRGDLTAEQIPEYARLVSQLPPLFWRLSRPVGRVRRFLRSIGLHRNPFLHGTEAELGELLRFFNQARMKSSTSPMVMAPLHDLGIS